MTQKRWLKQWSFMLAVAFAVSLAACSGSGSTTAATTAATTTTTTTTVDGSAATATATVTGTGTAGATTVTGLTVAEKISVVGSTTTSGKPQVTGLKMISSLLGLTVTLPSGWSSTANYYTDPQFTYTQERGNDALDTPNEILCMVAQLEADKMVNRGAYRAQVDKNDCSNNRDKSSQSSSNSGSSQGASNVPDYEDWTVISNRLSDTSPQVVSAWVHTTMGGPQGDQAAVIFAKATIAETPSSTNPYGMFTMSFKAHPETNGVVDTTKEVMHGLLRTVKRTSDSKVILQFFNVNNESKAGQSFSFNFATAVMRAPDGSSGSATASFPNFESVCGQTGCDFSALTNTVWQMGYDATTYARVPVVSGTADTTKLVCADKVNKKKAAWRYGLYKETDGSRKTLNSGFPIRYVDSSSVSHEGFVGYWGLWINDGATVADGATVKKQVWTNGTASETDYTYKKTKGRLIRHTNKSTTLDKIKNVPLSYWDQTAGTSKEVKWNGTKFEITGIQGTQGMTAVAAGTYLDVSQLSWSSTLFMWSQALGGQVIIELPVYDPNNISRQVNGVTLTVDNSCAKTGGWNGTNWANEAFNCTKALTAPALAKVTYLKEDVVMPDGKLSDGTAVTVPATLRCYENCPDASKFTTTTANTSIFHTRNFNMQSPTAYPYNWDGTNYLLKEGTTAIDLSTGSTAASNTNLTGDWGSLTYGLNTGVLFDPTAVDSATSKTYLQLLQCPWDTTSTCTWQAQQVLPVFYTWTTGAQDWNVLSALIDTSVTPNVAVKFDQPIDVTYTYPSTATGVNSTATDTKYTGVPFRFQYGGFGDLWGIPGHCVDGETGDDVDCMNATKWVRYIPEFMLSDGEIVTDDTYTGSGTTGKYRVKALEIEESMIGLAQSACANTPLTTLTLPTASDYEAPDIGTEPVVTDPPAVIGGVVQKTL